MKGRTLSLKDLKNVEWEEIVVSRSPRFFLDPNKMAVRFNKSTLGIVNRLSIRFGASLIKKLKWKVGDKICPYNDKEDCFTFMLAKTEAGTGYSLSAETNSSVTRIQFKFDKPGFTFPEISSQLVEFLTPNDKYIVFRIIENSP